MIFKTCLVFQICDGMCTDNDDNKNDRNDYESHNKDDTNNYD